LGHVKVTVRSKGADTPEEITAANIFDVVPHFVFSEAFRNELKSVSLERKG
jgi:hypothetical protein